MLDGREALSRIDRAVAEARQEAEALAGRLAALNEREIAARDGMRKAVDQLARFRLDQVRAGEVAAKVEDLGQEVEHLMREREESLADLASAEEAVGGRLAELEARRGDLARRAEEASDRVDAAEEALQQALEARADFREQQEKVEAAQAVAAEAQNKHAVAEQDRVSKGKPYEADPLFMYLWRRGYGTPAYRSRGLIAMLDRWVAGLVRFEGARRDYHVLTEIPLRLKEHADRMRAKAEAEVDAMVAIEEAAREASELPALEAGLEEARGAVEAIDAEIAAAREDVRKLAARRAAFTSGEDAHFRRAVDLIAAALDEESLAELRDRARRTPLPEDDRIVAGMLEIENDLEDLAGEREQLRDLAAQASRRVDELEDMRVEFRRRGYDDYSSVFRDEGLFAVILAEFVRGAITGGAYWDRLGRQHGRRARRSRPDFGSGRFRFPGPLSFPGSRGGFGGGGFGTGGGFGGGGFRTGGGF